MKADPRGKARSWMIAGRLAAFSVVGLVAAGCQSSSDPPTQIWGTVRYQGKPVQNGVIVLAPENGAGDTWGIGIINPDGGYSIMPSHTEKPIAAGRYGISFRLPPRIMTQHHLGEHEKDEPVSTSQTPRYDAVPATNGEIPEKYLDVEHPVFSIDLRRTPVQVDITLRD